MNRMQYLLLAEERLERARIIATELERLLGVGVRPEIFWNEFYKLQRTILQEELIGNA